MIGNNQCSYRNELEAVPFTENPILVCDPSDRSDRRLGSTNHNNRRAGIRTPRTMSASHSAKTGKRLDDASSRGGLEQELWLLHDHVANLITNMQDIALVRKFPSLG